MKSTTDKVAIIGVGCTKFGELWDKGFYDLVVDACYEAFEDASIKPEQIQAAWVGTGYGYHRGTALVPLHLGSIPISRLENACATGTDALRNAAYAVAAGAYDIVLVIGVEKIKGTFKVKPDSETHESKTLIIATGAKPRTLNVPGEKKFKNRGVTYCATCDAPLFANMDVAVIGGGNSALDATLQLMKIANRIFLININPSFRGDKVMIEKVEKSDKVVTLHNAKTLEILGDKMVTGIKLEKDGEQKILNVQGVFVEIGYVANSDLVANLVELNKRGEVVVDEHCKTNVPGIFAAGDVSNAPYKQIVVAAGDGAKAALSAYEYLSRLG